MATAEKSRPPKKTTKAKEEPPEKVRSDEEGKSDQELSEAELQKLSGGTYWIRRR